MPPAGLGARIVLQSKANRCPISPRQIQGCVFSQQLCDKNRKGRQFLPFEAQGEPFEAQGEPGGNLRRSSSKKLKMKLTLFTAGACSVPAFSTAKRFPSGCRS